MTLFPGPGAIAVVLVTIFHATTALGAIHPVKVVNMRLGWQPERTRIVFDMSAAVTFKLTTLSDPNRIVVDITESTSGFDHQSLIIAGTPISGIRTAVQSNTKLRYVFDLNREVEPRLFSLKPYLKKGYRLVLDLHEKEDSSPHGVDYLYASAENRRASREPTPANSPQSATAIPNPVSKGSPGEWSGNVGLETRLFTNDAAYSDQDNYNISVSFQPEYYQEWQKGRHHVAFSPFFRYDYNDDERSHVDIRELYWRYEAGDMAVKAGIDTVFWGVAESRHLVDIINQTDSVENIDGEDKLGQPMLSLEYYSDSWGTWRGFLLPYFRERTFPGSEGRPRTEPVVDTDDPIWDSNDEEENLDFALRWNHFFGDWDLGLAHFNGTSRDPFLVPSTDQGEARLLPWYLQIDQTSVDLQATKGAWLWKLEAIYNQNKLEDYFASVAGFEFTSYGVRGSDLDLGWLLEYHYDERDDSDYAVFQNDLYGGLRLTGNDAQSTRVLLGLTVDLDNGSTFGNLEGVRRLGESWTISMEVRTFLNVDNEDPMRFFEKDDYLELQLNRYF